MNALPLSSKNSLKIHWMRAQQKLVLRLAQENVINLGQQRSRVVVIKKLYAPLAQLVEQIPLKDKVEGSIPSGRTKHGMLCARRSESGLGKFSAENYS